MRAARIAMQLDPGPPLPMLAGQREAGAIRQDREVEVQGRNYRASANGDASTPYYYPGGRVSGRPVPAGWYSEPWWRTALTAGAWGIGSVLVFDALLSPGFGDYGYGQGYDAGFAAGDQQGYDQGYDQGQQQGDGQGDQGTTTRAAATTKVAATTRAAATTVGATTVAAVSTAAAGFDGGGGGDFGF